VSFSSIDTSEQLIWITFMLEVDQIFIISVNPNISVRSPSSLNFFCCQLVLCLQLDLLFSFKIPSPGPLNLNCSNMVHCESMIFEKSSCQRHFIRCLNNSSAKISQALIFVLMHDIERRCQEFLPQLLSSC